MEPQSKNKKEHMGEKRRLQKEMKKNMKVLIKLKLLPTQELIYRFRGGRNMR